MVPERQIRYRDAMMATPTQGSVLFLCTGNYYRSRFAEILFNSIAGKMGLPWRALSKGLALERGAKNIGPIATATIKALEACGVRDAAATSRFPAPLSNDDLATARIIVALKRDEHLPLLEERHPAWAEKVEFWQIDDDADALSLIEREVNGLVARLLGGGHRVEETTVEHQPRPEPKKKPVTVKVGRETAGRRGKGVTTVYDTPLDEEGLKELAGILKQRCGTGGTVKDGRIEIQGDQRERIIGELEKLGYKAKRVGG
jgi:predicted translation initiation factor SUI1